MRPLFLAAAVLVAAPGAALSAHYVGLLFPSQSANASERFSTEEAQVEGDCRTY